MTKTLYNKIIHNLNKSHIDNFYNTIDTIYNEGTKKIRQRKSFTNDLITLFQKMQSKMNKRIINNKLVKVIAFQK